MPILLLILFSLASLALHAQGEKKDKLYTRIDSVWYHFEKLDLDPYIDAPARQFLKEQDAPFIFKQILPSDRPAYTGMLRLIYPEGVYVDLYVRRYQYTNPNGFLERKNIARFGRENVAAIRVHNDLACLNGCD